MNAKSRAKVFLCLGVFLVLCSVSCLKVKEHSYNRNQLLGEVIKDQISVDSLRSVREVYQKQLREVKEKYPAVYERLQMTDLAYTQLLSDYMQTDSTLHLSTSTKKIVCLLSAVTGDEPYKYFCSQTPIIPHKQCKTPIGYAKGKYTPGGGFEVGCDVPCAIITWISCITSP